MSHRGKEFIAIAAEAEALLRELLAVPANYKVLFMQGGAIAENAIVPMNLLRGKASADYIDTGEWSKKSIKEAQKYGSVNVAASAADSGYDDDPAARRAGSSTPTPPTCTSAATRPSAACEYHFTPDVGDVPLVADMSSDILSRPIDVSKYGLIYGGAQKNIGPAGLTHRHRARRPASASALPMHADAPSTTRSWPTTTRMYNTPPTYAIYIAGLVFRWIKAQRRPGGDGGAQPRQGGAALRLPGHDRLLRAARWPATAARWMNVPFKLHDEALDAAFLKGAEARGMVQLKGHRSVGGMRASIYNAMPVDGVQALVAYMKEFEAARG
ncbi:MAG: 3-phosphoserine/phosphohydroxythreonine transaminase [Comamonadaceae bacterium]|nr:3-phosphoserine/phosphohydroxythreonine transaminase [Comamonadaceae bacterium]